MAIKIEINYRKHFKNWEVRVGDLEGSSSSCNVSQEEVLFDNKKVKK